MADLQSLERQMDGLQGGFATLEDRIKKLEEELQRRSDAAARFKQDVITNYKAMDNRIKEAMGSLNNQTRHERHFEDWKSLINRISRDNLRTISDADIEAIADAVKGAN